MFIKGDGISTTHRCDSCGEDFVIMDDVKNRKERFLIVDRSKMISHNEDFNHYANGLSYCGTCSKVIARAMNLTFPKF